jgi:hypothetical protein
MNSGVGIRFGRWRQSITEVLVGASVVVIAFAAIDSTAQLILGALALVGIALMLERDVPAESAGNIDPQPMQPPEESARPERQATARFDPALVDATSV